MRLIVLACALMLGGCSVLGLSDEDDGVRVRVDGTDLVVENHRPGDIYYAAVGENALVLIGPCVRPDCPRLAPGEVRTIPFAEIPAPDSPRLLLHWWARIGAEGAAVPGPVRTIAVAP